MRQNGIRCRLHDLQARFDADPDQALGEIHKSAQRDAGALRECQTRHANLTYWIEDVAEYYNSIDEYFERLIAEDEGGK